MELYAAEAIFLTGSGAGVVPVAEVDGRPIATAEHPHVSALADAYRARTRDERFLVPIR
jgi:branched-chain amino acid aminotransferase